MDDRAERNICDRERVARLDIRVRTGFNYVSDFQLVRSDDVALNAVCVNDECDVSCSVRIVLDRLYCCRNVVLRSLEVDDPVFRSVSAASVSDGDLASYVSSRVLLKGDGKRLFRLIGRDIF